MARSVARPGGADTEAVSPPPPLPARGRGLIQCVRFKARLAAAGGLRWRPKLHQICAEQPSLGQAAPCVSALLLVCPTFHHNPDTGPDPRQTASPRGGLHGEVGEMISEGNLAQFSYDFCKTDGLFPYNMSTSPHDHDTRNAGAESNVKCKCSSCVRVVSAARDPGWPRLPRCVPAP